ncbi:MAG: FixH family protein [Pseudomonadota bacterium]
MTVKPLTGRKVFAITLGCFAVIFGANMALLYSALGSFPGLEVKNSYVASQSFDRHRAAQQALGWEASVSYAPGRIALRVTDRSGQMVTPRILSASVGRATHVKDDQQLAFGPSAEGMVSPARLSPGFWQVRLVAEAADGTRFAQRLALRVPDPS